MSIDGDRSARPVIVRREIRVVRDPSSAGWWIAAVVAVVAIVGVIFLLNGRPASSELQAARDQGAAEANLDNATGVAQAAAVQATQAAQDATRGAAQATEAAANTTADAARSTADAARNVSANAPTSDEPAPPPQ